MLELEQSPSQCLLIEDSPAGVESALKAGADVIALSTAFTKKRLHEMKNLNKAKIVDNPAKLIETVEAVFAEHNVPA